MASAKRALEAERAFLVDAHGVARVLGVEVEGVDSAMALWGSKDGSEALRTALAAATWRGHFTRDASRTRKMKLEKGLGGSEVAAEIIVGLPKEKKGLEAIQAWISRQLVAAPCALYARASREPTS